MEDPLRDVLRSSTAHREPRELSANLRDVDLSLTEKEIRLGAESAEQAKWPAFAYFRELKISDGEVLGEPFVDLNEAGALADPRSSEKLRALRRRLRRSPDVATHFYTARLQEGRVDRRYLDRLQKRVYSDLKIAIDAQIATFHAQPRAAREIEAHGAFGAERRRNYVSRPVEARVHEYLDRDDRRPLVLHGASGAGKTALLAKLAADVAERRPRHISAVRFIGATGESTSLRSLIRSIHAQVAAESGSIDASESMQADPPASFRATLAMGTPDRPLVVFLDALDQLSLDDRALSGGWIPRELPADCHFVATCITQGASNEEGAGVFDALAGRLDPGSMLSIDDPNLPELRLMLTTWLRSYSRQLAGHQLEAVEAALVACPRPLFLRVLVEITRHWREDTTVDELPAKIPDAIEQFLEGLEAQHGRALVSSTLGLLAASRSGLTEVEFVELIRERADVIEEFRTGSRYDYVERLGRLPPVVWSRLFFDLALFLRDTTIAGVSALGFYHRQLRTVARVRSESRVAEFRRELAGYFERSAAWYTDGGRTPNARRAYELPFQLRELEDHDALIAVMTDPVHVEAKIRSGLGDDLLRDFFAMDGVDGIPAEALVSFFARQYIDAQSALAAAFEASDLHSFFAYRGTTSFYGRLLRALVGDPRRAAIGGDAGGRARRIRSRARVDLGGMLRRGRAFDEARQMLFVVDEPDSGLGGSDLGTGWYEVGYVHYMQDEYAEAVRALRLSAQLADAGGDRVGAAISRVVELWAAYKDEPDRPGGLESMMTELEGALALFTEAQNTDGRALRWVMNALADLVNTSFLLGDARRLEGHLRDLRANAWIREFSARDSLLVYEARFAMAAGWFDDAVSYWERFLGRTPIEEDTEAGAWPLFDYGTSLARSGKVDLARRTCDRALALRSRGANNAFWQRLVREARARLSEG